MSASAASPTHGWHRLIGWWVLLLAFLVLAGWLCEEVFEQETIAFDRPVMLWVHDHASELQDRLALFLDMAGGLPVMASLTVMVCLGLIWKHKARLAWPLGLSLLGAATLTWIMKLFFDRPRPDLWTPLVRSFGDSFPSGHSLYAACMPFALALLFGKGPWRMPLLMLAACWMLMVGWSRIYLGVHYPSDVLAGWSIGLAWAFGVWQFFEGRSRPAT